MRTTFDISFWCRNSKIRKGGKAPLELAIVINGERKIIQLPTMLDVEEFNKKKQKPEIRQLITEWSKKVDDCIVILLQEEKPITADNLRDLLRTGGTRSYTIEDCFNDFLAIYKKRVGKDLTYSGYRKYELTKELFFKHFDKSKQITTVTPSAIQN